MVRPGVGVVPLAVPPPDHLPQQMEQLQYAVSLNLPRYLPLEVSIVVSVVLLSLFEVVVLVDVVFCFFSVADAACCAAFCCAAFLAAASSAAFFSAASFAAASWPAFSAAACCAAYLAAASSSFA